MTIDTTLERAINLGQNEEIAVTRTELVSMLIKKDQALVGKTRLKRISSEVTNMTAEL